MTTRMSLSVSLSVSLAWCLFSFGSVAGADHCPVATKQESPLSSTSVRYFCDYYLNGSMWMKIDMVSPCGTKTWKWLKIGLRENCDKQADWLRLHHPQISETTVLKVCTYDTFLGAIELTHLRVTPVANHDVIREEPFKDDSDESVAECIRLATED